MRTALIAILAVAACGGPPQPPTWSCDDTSFCASGIRVEGVPDELQTEDLRTRLEHEIAVSANFWGHPVSELAGWRIVYYPLEAAQTTGLPGCTLTPVGRCNGLTVHETRTIYLRLAWTSCLEAQQLPHEIGHVLIGDTLHQDERWPHVMDLGPQIIDVQPSCSALWGQNIGWSHPLDSP